MTETEFDDLVDATLTAIEDAVDESGLDVDCECSDGVLTVSSDSGGSLIFSRQSGNQELWLAARSGGFHFRYRRDNERSEGEWYSSKTGQSLTEVLYQVCRDQLGQALDIS